MPLIAFNFVFVFASMKLLMKVSSVSIDMVDCGVDHKEEVLVGDIHIKTYPWLGVLYYTDEQMNGVRSVTPVVLIQAEFCIGSAAEIGEMPKKHFRKNTRVLFGQDWYESGRRIRNYVIHPQYGETYNTLAVVQLKAPIRDGIIRPICPPPDLLRDPEFYVVRFKNDYDNLQKEVLPMYHVPRMMCRDFYVAANLYAVKMRPPHVVCACSVHQNDVCVWEAGSVLVTRDIWGRWLFLGFGVRGPGCGAPSRYLDMLSYYPWIHSTLDKFRRVTISKLTNQKYVVRSGGGRNSDDFESTRSGATISEYARFGACDEEEKENILYREYIKLQTDNPQFQFLTYNLTIAQSMEISCLTLELVNASSTSEMLVRHFCSRENFGHPCYHYTGSIFDISVYIMFSDSCKFEMLVWGYDKNLTLQDVMEWKWEEGSHYLDFAMDREEYLGQSFMTTLGFEPYDPRLFTPDYDVWSTTDGFDRSISITTREPDRPEEAVTPPASQMLTFAPELGPAPTRRPQNYSNVKGWRSTKRPRVHWNE